MRHYLTLGERQGRWPHPLFDPAWYLGRYPDVAASGQSAFLHFLRYGLKEGREFSPFISLDWYLQQHPDVQLLKVHPATYLLTSEDGRLTDPNPNFSSRWYLLNNPDVKATRVHPYIHYLKHGREEGRSPLPITIGDLSNAKAGIAVGRVSLESYGNVISPLDREPRQEPHQFDPEIDLGSIDFVSFDVWSTLLHRQCHPDEIKLQSARYLLLHAYEDLRPGFRALRELYELRIQSENSSAPNKDFEYRLSDAVFAWLSVALDPGVSKSRRLTLASAVLDHEFVAEARSTHRDEAVSAYAGKLEVPKIFASDFYTSADFISKLLRHHEVGGIWTKGYSSSDSFKNKRSGSLFRKILSDLSVEPRKLLHIGDNPVADLAVPRALGVSTQPYESPSETQRMHWYGEAFLQLLNGDASKHNSRILSLLEGLCDETVRFECSSERELYQIGVRIAPIAFSFVLSVVEDSLRCGSDRIFFFTREGLFFKRVYDEITNSDPYNAKYPSAQILSVSRRATFAASLTDFSIDEMMRLWTMYSSQSIRGFAVSLNLDNDICSNIAQKYYLDPDAKIVYPWLNESFKGFMSDPDLVMHARYTLELQKKNLSSYLRQAGFYSESRPIVVDIGWRGTIQDNLSWLTRKPIKGHYLALFRFLNKQPSESEKTGWLGDSNLEDRRNIPDQVAPLEMIFNGEGGSVVGYQEWEGVYEAITEIVTEEESVVQKLKPLQDGMVAAVSHLARYVRLHGLLAENLKPLARELTEALIAAPPTPIADLFAELTHNEAFGAGHAENVGGSDDFGKLSQLSDSKHVHFALEEWLKSTRWAEGAVRQTKMRQWWMEAPRRNAMASPLLITKAYSPAIQQMLGDKLAVYVPGVLNASGGHRTIFNMVKSLADIGLEPHIFADGVGAGLHVIEEYLSGTSARIYTNWRYPMSSSIAFATIAHSAKFVSDNVDANKKFYLVQDAEALFNPIGDAYVTAENSYAQGLLHITVGNWLSHVIRGHYGGVSEPAGLGVDTAVYKLSPSPERENAICMLFQPEKPRRGNMLALDAIRLLKTRHPDLKVYLYGSAVKIETEFEAEQLGVISDLNELNKLYNRCKAGICISLSNPSRIPFEMMAAGCIPVDVYRYNNLMDYENGTALLAYQDARSIALALEMALGRQAAGSEAAESLAHRAKYRSLKWETDMMASYVLDAAEHDGFTNTMPVSISYTEAPIIAAEGDENAAQAFCNWQRFLAFSSQTENVQEAFRTDRTASLRRKRG